MIRKTVLVVFLSELAKAGSIAGSPSFMPSATGIRSDTLSEEIVSFLQNGTGNTPASSNEPSLVLLFAISLLWIPFNRWKKQ